MDDAETFNQQRMDRCMRIAQTILENSRKAKTFSYTARATQSVEGLPLNELRKQYFTVGWRHKLLEDVPFLDLLVILSAVEQNAAELKKHLDKGETEFSVHYKLTTHWPDEAVADLLSRWVIQTPYDKGKHLRLAEVRPDPDNVEDDPQM